MATLVNHACKCFIKLNPELNPISPGIIMQILLAGLHTFFDY